MKNSVAVFVTCLASLLSLAASGQTLTAGANLDDSAGTSGSPGLGLATVVVDPAKGTVFARVDFKNLLYKSTELVFYKGSVRVTAPLDGFPSDYQGSTDPSKETHDATVGTFWDNGYLGGGTPTNALANFAADVKSGAITLAINSTGDFSVGEIRGVVLVKPLSLAKLTARLFQSLFLGDQTLLCSGLSERCIVPAYVYTRGNNCEVRIEFKEVQVKKHTDQGKKVRVIWLLVNGDLGDADDYRFAPTGGVTLNKNADNVPNDLGKDFNTPDVDNQDARRFKWNSVHKRVSPGDVKPFPYAANAERRDRQTDAWLPCRPVDPTISNVD